TRVSNPVRSPRFRVSASVSDHSVAFATGVPGNIYAFHRYTTSSTDLFRTQEIQYRRPFYREAVSFHLRIRLPPEHPLHPIIPDNACTLRITAAAGTELAGACSIGTVSGSRKTQVLPDQKLFTTHRAVFQHA